MVFRLRRRRATHASAPAAASIPIGADRRVLVVHRVGALAVGLFLLVFGLLGLAGGLAFISTHGERIVGLSSNGLLSTISVIMAAVLIAAALRGPRTASTVMMIAGVLFLVSGLVNLAVLETPANILAFRLPNVFFSFGAGLLLLLLGAYGRVSGNLPTNSPYAHPHETRLRPEELPTTPEEAAAERAMADAELALLAGTASAEQRRRIEWMTGWHDRATQRRVWMSFDQPPRAVPAPAPAPARRTRAGRVGLLEKIARPRSTHRHIG